MRELDSQNDRWMQRLDSLVALQLNGEIADAESDELLSVLESHPEAYRLYVEFVVDSSNLRCLSDASSCVGQNGAKATPLPPRKDRWESEASTWNRSNSYLAGVAGLALTVCVMLALSLPAVKTDVDSPTDSVAQVNGQLAEPEQALSEIAKHIGGEGAGGSVEEAPRIQEVATVISAENVLWAKDNLGVGELTRLSVGQTLHFSEGYLDLVFDRSVRMRVRGPALIEIRSPMEIYSRFGILSARVGAAGKGFVIETPNGRIVDLGTEFGVAVDQHGVTDVAVFQGAVDLTYGPHDSLAMPSMTRRVVQGQALTLSLDGTMKRLVSFNDNRFPLLRSGSTMFDDRRAPVITRVTDNIRDGIDVKSYRIVPAGLRDDAQAYVDREHEWNGVDQSGIPEILRYADYIMPFNQDKYLSDLEVNVSVGRPARLFVFMSPMANVPAWLSENFEKTNMRIGLDEGPNFVNAAGDRRKAKGLQLSSGAGQAVDTEFFVWQRDITLPSEVVLGGVRQARRGWGFCMYGIAAVPLETAERFDAQLSQ